LTPMRAKIVIVSIRNPNPCPTSPEGIRSAHTQVEQQRLATVQAQRALNRCG